MKSKPVHEKVIAVKIPVWLDNAIEKYAVYNGILKRTVIINFLSHGVRLWTNDK